MADSRMTGCLDAFSKQLGNASMVENSSNDFYDESDESLSEFEKTLSRIDDIFIKIKLIDNKPLVWKAEEWLKLQKNRICGTLVGTPANFSSQVSENGLPLLLLPEEVTLIIEKNLGKAYRYKKDRTFPSEKVKEEYSEYLRKNVEEQKTYYNKLCKEQVLERIDSIIEGKKKKSLSKQSVEGTTSEVEFDREALIQSEIDRKVKAATASHLIQIPTSSPWLTEKDLEEVVWTYPETSKEKLKYRVYKDLYEKGYSLTPCAKFGGDFLVYPGESWKFHSYFIVICLEFEEEFKFNDLISNTRLSVFTRKNLVLASVDENDEIFYNTLSWPTKISA